VNAAHRAVRELLGAYVLDQLTDDERIAVEAHLDGCADCRAEVAELAPLVSAMRDVDPDRVSAPAEPPTELAARIGETICNSRRRRDRGTLLRRGAAGLLVAAALVGAFVLGVSRQPDPGTAAPPVVPLTVHLVAAGVQADAGLVRHTWGTELKLKATGLRDGGSYTVTFIRRDGTAVSGGTFIGTGSNTLNCSLNGALPLDEMVEVTVTDGSGALVLDAERI
jgi:anti-sigma factor RsiW